MTSQPTPRILYETCPLCDSRAFSHLLSADCTVHARYHPVVPRMMKWMRCECEHVFTDGYFPDDVLELVFQKTYDIQKPGADFERQRFLSSHMVDKVLEFQSAGRWLDVGFGNGSLLHTAQEYGFTPVGLDLRAASVAAMSKLGVECYCEDIATFDRGRFNVISMADVLEHMPFPRVGLSAAHRLLNPDGVLMVSMPNYNCPAWRLLDTMRQNPYWFEIEHYHNFSRQRLFDLLTENGFQPLRYGVSERYRICMEIIARRVGD